MSTDQLQINIPHYPPFKLRSSLIDKDPVIWVHSLESYIRLFMFLDNNEMYGYNLLNIKSQQQLQLFLKVYLFETAQEDTQIFSLGHINPDIVTNTELLRARVFSFVKNTSIIKLKLTGEMIWDFISIYASGNGPTVRQLVDGTFKSKFNEKKSGGISSIPVLYKHLKEKIINGKFAQADLETLSSLLGQHITNKVSTINVNSGTSTNKTIKRGNTSAMPFAEEFVKSEWIEILEELYLGVHRETAKNVMIISLISLSVANISKLAMNIHVTSPQTLQISPLFSSLIISEPFQQLIPGLEERLQFLRNITFGDGTNDDDDDEDNEDNSMYVEHVLFLVELFPDLSESKALKILKDNNGDVDHVTNLILENPDLINTIQETQPKSTKKKSTETKSKTKNTSHDGGRFKEESTEKILRSLGATRSSELNSKTLASALEMLYDSDEDEPDDSYTWEGAAAENAAVMEGANSEKGGINQDARRSRDSTTHSSVLVVERYLYSFFKDNGAPAFTRNSRNTPSRQQLKIKSGWTDEQIEGWFRMLEKVPKRLKILERDYFENGSRNKPKPAEKEDENDDGEDNISARRSKVNSAAKLQRDRNYANKKKASQGNHNRKAKLLKKTS